VSRAGSFFATGHPVWPVHPSWDFGPFAISLVLLVLLRIARLPLRVPVVIGAFVAGLLIDDVSHAMGVSIVHTMAFLLAMSLLASLRSTETR
jgi:hypothetical protein